MQSWPHRFLSFLEDKLDSSYVSALAALAGAAIGGLTSFATTFTAQRMQLQNARRQAETTELTALYSEFITEAARVFGEALTHRTKDVTSLVQLYAMVGRMRLISGRSVIDAAQQVEDTIIDGVDAPSRRHRNVPR
jgi:hypothetical protein